jgi:hypothetical protein
MQSEGTIWDEHATSVTLSQAGGLSETAAQSMSATCG